MLFKVLSFMQREKPVIRNSNLFKRCSKRAVGGGMAAAAKKVNGLMRAAESAFA